ncbi:ADP-ribosylglycohydrolase family protein [Algivirga pacifica]
MLTADQFYDKVLGGWIGKCAGGILGAPIEGYKRFNDIQLDDSLFESNYPNDDLDLQILWLDMAAKKGVKIRGGDFREHWKNHVDFPWNEYGIATRNIRVGLDHPDTGRINNTYWNESMGSPIRSELWGMLCAFHPTQAAFYARIDSQLDHHGFSDDAEAYWAACAALAFGMEDIPTILQEGLKYIPKESVCANLVKDVMEWYNTYGVKVTSGKIKSAYGDADFTSAPMNVAYTVLSLLLSEGDFDKLIQALHFGHDSDCIVATAGALLGIVRGAKEIPELWKTRIGNDLMVSPEIKGVEVPDTVTALTEKTCQVARTFQHYFGNKTMINIVAEECITFERSYTLITELGKQPTFGHQDTGLIIAVRVESQQQKEQSLTIRLTSDAFAQIDEAKVLLKAEEEQECIFEIVLKEEYTPEGCYIPYQVEVIDSNGKEQLFERGIPYYGSWTLLGPFIQDDPALEPMDGTYPDHGLSSMPSAVYMNHDRQLSDNEFVSFEMLEEILQSPAEQSFMVQEIYPDSFEIDLGEYFYGKGERTLYLLTDIYSESEVKKWLCVGSSQWLTVWLNGENIHHNTRLQRRWPSTDYMSLDLKEGVNRLMIRLDCVHDDYKVSIGLKEHPEKHPHQSQWETVLNFSSPLISEHSTLLIAE